VVASLFSDDLRLRDWARSGRQGPESFVILRLFVLIYVRLELPVSVGVGDHGKYIELFARVKGPWISCVDGSRPPAGRTINCCPLVRLILATFDRLRQYPDGRPRWEPRNYTAYRRGPWNS
jgi:hypothetical protein